MVMRLHVLIEASNAPDFVCVCVCVCVTDLSALSRNSLREGSDRERVGEGKRITVRENHPLHNFLFSVDNGEAYPVRQR